MTSDKILLCLKHHIIANNRIHPSSPWIILTFINRSNAHKGVNNHIHGNLCQHYVILHAS